MAALTSSCAGEVLDRHDAAGAQLAHDVDLPAVPHSAKIAATSAHIHAVAARFCAVLPCQRRRAAGTMAASSAPPPPAPGAPARDPSPRVHVRPAGRPPGAGRAGVRRLPVGDGVPRHRLHRPGEHAGQRHRGLGRRDGLLPRRHRQPGHRLQPAGPAHLPGRGVRGRRLRRLLLAHPGRAGARGPAAVPPVRALALPGDRLDGRQPGPQHGHPRARRAHDGHRDDRPPTALPGRVRRPQPGRAARDQRPADLGRPGPRRGRPRLRRRGLGPHRRLVRPRPGAAVGLPRVPAQRRRGDGLHPHRHRRTTRSTPSPTGCRSRW